MKKVMVVPRWFPATESNIRELASCYEPIEHGKWLKHLLRPTVETITPAMHGHMLFEAVCNATTDYIDRTGYHYCKMLETLNGTRMLAVMMPKLTPEEFKAEAQRLMDKIAERDSPFDVKVDSEIIPGNPYAWRATVTCQTSPMGNFEIFANKRDAE